jgi:hypothetical protein
MSSGMMHMYGHRVGSYSKKPHMETVQAIRRSTIAPYITSPVGVGIDVAQPLGISPVLLNPARVPMGDYGQVNPASQGMFSNLDGRAAVVAPPLVLRAASVAPAAPVQGGSIERQVPVINLRGSSITINPVNSVSSTPQNSRVSVPVAPVVSQQNQRLTPPINTRSVPNVQPAAVSYRPPIYNSIIQQASASVPVALSAAAPPAPVVQEAKASDGGGAVARTPRTGRDQLREMYNLSENDIMNIMQIIQKETTNVYGSSASSTLSTAAAAVAAATPTPTDQPGGFLQKLTSVPVSSTLENESTTLLSSQSEDSNYESLEPDNVPAPQIAAVAPVRSGGQRAIMAIAGRMNATA